MSYMLYKQYICNKCKEVFHYQDEVVFDGDELKTVDELNPDWNECTCNTCYYEEDVDGSSKSDTAN
jgi:predicted nucleic-acid-binding Zn-ribbon protein